MIEDIDLIGLKQETIDELFDKLGYATVLNMACNYKKIKENISIFKSIHINNIEELLINKNEIFFKEPSYIIKVLSNLNIPEVVASINDSYEIIDEIFD